MLRQAKIKWLSIVPVMIVALLASTAMAGTVSLTGEVNDNYQLVTDGQVYEIADTPEGNDLAENHISEKVKVVGTVQESEDLKIITVASYQVIAE